MESNKTALIIHGGANSENADFILEHEQHYREGLKEAAMAAWKVLQDNGSAVDAVECAVMALENNELFNCGKGSAMNEKGHVEMDALIIDGRTLKSGAVAMVRNVKNPVALAKAVMQRTNCMLLGAAGALEFAKHLNIELKNDAYFFTPHQVERWKKEKESGRREHYLTPSHGTVGAVALDAKGNLASAVSTGGTLMCNEGRIGDTAIFGIGGYADNTSCAVAATGDGEAIIRNVISHSIAMLMQSTAYNMQSACEYMIHEKNKDAKADIGVIGIDPQGHFGIAFNSKVMPRAWISTEGQLQIEIS